MATKTEKATFGAGCFWHVESAFAKLKGVKSTVVGYSGGMIKDPTYSDVCTNRTGHVEVVQVEFDPKKISYEDLIKVFWKIHDPTTPNRQGPDVGTQYRSVIFYHSEKQSIAAAKSKEAEQKNHSQNIVTKIEKASTFYKAEEYHQKYFEKRRITCHI